MEFNNMEELIDYIDDHSSFMTEEPPYCSYCDECLTDCNGYISYIRCETDTGYELFCNEDCAIEYFKQYLI